MSVLRAFPLDNTPVTAAHFGQFLGTRTRGVYSAEDMFTVTANGDMTVTVSPGLAWLHWAEYWGIAALLEGDTVLTIPTADGLNPRVDGIAVRADKLGNLVTLAVLQGIPAGDPVGEPPVRDEYYDDIIIARIDVGVAATSILQTDIYSTIMDETLCGVMRDGVTGLPTSTVQASAETLIAELKCMAEQAASGSIVDGSVTTPKIADGAVTAEKIASGALPVGRWTELAKFETAGAVEWTAPDVYGDGREYEIGVLVVGAGGNGVKFVTTQSRIYGCSGGSAGFSTPFSMRVVPGDLINGVVGGPRQVSVFNGIEAKFGSDGSIVYGSPYGNLYGSQISHDVDVPLWGGILSSSLYTTGAFDNGGMLIGRNQAVNPFTGLPFLGAGGYFSDGPPGTGEYKVFPGGKDLITGLGGGDSVLGGQAEDATSPGCGGGTALLSVDAGERIAEGAPGAIYIYI